MCKFLRVLLASFFVFSSPVTPLRAEITLPPEVMQAAVEGINGVYSLDFATAEKNIQKVFSLYPDHPFAHFGNAMIAWARYEYEFETSDEKQRKVFEKVLDDSIEGIKRWLKNNPKDPNAYMGLGALNGLRALFNMRNRNWVTSYFAGRKAISNLETSLKLDPTYYDAYFGLGVYEYFAGTLPAVIKVLAKIVAIKGNPDTGVRYLNKARTFARFTQDSAKLILIQVQNTRGSRFYAPEKSLEYIRELHKKFPNNPLMGYVEIICLYETGDFKSVSTKASHFLELIGTNPYYKEIYIPRAYTALGTTEMAQGNFERARQLFEEGAEKIKKQDPSRWGVWNALRLGQVYDVLGEREKAQKQYRYVLSFKDKWGFDDLAKSLLKTPYKVPAEGVGPLPPI